MGYQMNKEDFLKAIMEFPKVEANNPISTMNGINVEDLMSAIDRLNKVPDYNDLLKENKKQKEAIDKVINMLKNNFVYEYIRSCDASDGIGYDEIDTEHFTYKAYKILKEVSE